MKPSTPKAELPPSTRLRKAVFGGSHNGFRRASIALTVLAGLALTASGQNLPQSGTNTISGLVRFVNTDADILARLGPPGDEGMTSFAVLAYTDPPEVLQANKIIYTADHLSSPYALTVSA